MLLVLRLVLLLLLVLLDVPPALLVVVPTVVDPVVRHDMIREAPGARGEVVVGLGCVFISRPLFLCGQRPMCGVVDVLV